MKRLQTYIGVFSGFVTAWFTNTGIVFAVQIRERERERERERSNQAVTGFRLDKPEYIVCFNRQVYYIYFIYCLRIFMESAGNLFAYKQYRLGWSKWVIIIHKVLHNKISALHSSVAASTINNHLRTYKYHCL